MKIQVCCNHGNMDSKTKLQTLSLEYSCFHGNTMAYLNLVRIFCVSSGAELSKLNKSAQVASKIKRTPNGIFELKEKNVVNRN